MSKLRCFCGHTIIDQTDQLPYKAHLVPDEDIDTDIEFFVAQLKELVAAGGQRNQEASASSKAYPEAEETLDALFAIVSGMVYRSGRDLYECEQCGRLWIQKYKGHDQHIFVSYLPEKPTRGVLRSQRNTPGMNEKPELIEPPDI